MKFCFFNHPENNIAFYENDKVITYGMFKNRLFVWINHLSQKMSSGHLQRGDRVFFQLPQSVDLVLAYYSCLSLGLVAVPIFDSNPIGEIEGFAALTTPKCFMTNHTLFKRLNYSIKEFEDLIGAQVLFCDDFEYSDTAPHKSTAQENFEQEDAILFFTSGSTGKPKAVVYTYKTLYWVNKIYQEFIAITSQDIMITGADLNGNAGFAFQILPILEAGAAIYILTERTGEQFLKGIVAGGTLTCTMPWLGMNLLNYIDKQKKKVFTNKLRYCLVGGDIVPKRFYLEFYQAFNVRPSELLGMSETNIYATNLQHHTVKQDSVGKALPHTQISIRDQDNQKLQAGEVGEIVVKTPMMFDRYWGSSIATENTIVKDWVKTGDLGYLDNDGFLYFSGRLKNIIINCGDNLYPREIQQAIMSHSNIRNVVVIGIPNEITGADIGVAITLNIKNKPLTKEMLSEFLKDKLSLNKHPVKIIIYDEDFPKSKAGKSDRNKIFQDLINAQ